MDDPSTSRSERSLAPAVRYRNSVSPGSGSELLKDISDMSLNGHFADEQLLSDVSIAHTLGDER